MPKGSPRSAEVAVAGVDDLGVHPEDLGELLDHHVEDQLAELVLVFGPGQQRPPVQHDARSGGRVPRVAGVRRAADDAGQRHRLVFADGVGVRDLLDRELHGGQFGLPARLEPRHRLEHQVVELLGPAPVERDAGRHQAAAQPAPVPVAPLRPDHGPWPRAAFAGLHSHRAYPIATYAGYHAKHDTTAARSAGGGFTARGQIPSRLYPTPSRAPGTGPQGDVSEVGWWVLVAAHAPHASILPSTRSPTCTATPPRSSARWPPTSSRTATTCARSTPPGSSRRAAGTWCGCRWRRSRTAPMTSKRSRTP